MTAAPRPSGAGRPAPGAWLAAGEIEARPYEERARRARRRLAWSLGGAFVAAIGLVAVLDPFFGGDEAGLHRRSSLSARADGFRGIVQVLEELGFRTERHLRSYGMLPPAAESVLVIIDPMPSVILERFESTRIDAAQVRLLREWVEQGGHLVLTPPGRVPLSVEVYGVPLDFEEGLSEAPESVVDGVLGDAPERERAPAGGAIEGAGELEGFEHELAPPPAELAHLAVAFIDAPRRRLFVEREDDGGPIPMPVFAADAEGFTEEARLDGRPLVLATRKGDGRVWLLSSPYLFSNLAVAKCGAGHLVAALADLATEGGARTIYVDEYCHGLRPSRGLFGWVFHTALFYPVAGGCLLFALFLWRGAVRLGPPARVPVVRRRSKEEYVISLADIALRARRFRAAARWTLELWRARILDASGRRAEERARGELEGLGEVEELLGRVEGGDTFGERDLERVAEVGAEIRRRLRRGSGSGHGKGR